MTTIRYSTSKRHRKAHASRVSINNDMHGLDALGICHVDDAPVVAVWVVEAVEDFGVV